MKPLRETGLPTFVIDARRQLGYVIGRGVGFKLAKLPEIVNRV
jgi:hypothetical protein